MLEIYQGFYRTTATMVPCESEATHGYQTCWVVDKDGGARGRQKCRIFRSRLRKIITLRQWACYKCSFLLHLENLFICTKHTDRQLDNNSILI